MVGALDFYTSYITYLIDSIHTALLNFVLMSPGAMQLILMFIEANSCESTLESDNSAVLLTL